ncbi:WhiB family transcriptional regulator [Intrasporangium sp. DVR]|uniref:WhiB family transcriptional regulator n=1 Tax=Intrasporangium sp. DVR TaxID=3127867 RepID=UPI00313A5D1E
MTRSRFTPTSRTLPADHAPCTIEDPELFWPATESEAGRAKAVCGGCPIARRCLTTAQERGEWGVWGGELLARGRASTDLPGKGRQPSRTPQSA